MLAVPEGTTTPPGIQAPELVTETAPLSQAYGVETPAADAERSTEMQAAATPASDVTSMADAAPTMTAPAPEVPPQPAPAPGIPWLRVLAVASLLIALGLGALGWLRR
jgi:hypothetical protein